MSKMVDRAHRAVWRFALSIPYGKTLLLILNSYVWRGDPQAFLRFAPISFYLRRLILKILVLLICSYAFAKLGRCYGLIKDGPMGSIDTALQLFPNVLGFGIGAYALLFTFPDRFFENLEASKRDKKLRVGAQGLNAIMAFPLLAIAAAILVAAIVKPLRLPQVAEDTIGLFIVVYGMLLTMELVAVLFVSARKVIRNVVTSSASPVPSETLRPDENPKEDSEAASETKGHS